MNTATIYQPHTDNVRCMQVPGTRRFIFGHKVWRHRCPKCGSAANVATYDATCTGRRIVKTSSIVKK